MSGLGYISVDIDHLDALAVASACDAARERIEVGAPAGACQPEDARHLVTAAEKLRDAAARAAAALEREAAEEQRTGRARSPVTTSAMTWLMYPVEQLVAVGRACTAAAVGQVPSEQSVVEACRVHADALRALYEARRALLAQRRAALGLGG